MAISRYTLKKLKIEMTDLTFAKPNIKLEQYHTPSQIAADVLYYSQAHYGDIEDKSVADLGCGCGIFLVGTSLLGCGHCTGFDVDQIALEQCQENLEECDVQNCDLVLADVTQINPLDEHWWGRFDTVVMNPPFGTKSNHGIDVEFLKVAIGMAKTAVYSLHKSATREYFVKKSKEWNIELHTGATLKFNIGKSRKKDKFDSIDIEVDVLRFSFPHGKEVFRKKLLQSMTVSKSPIS